MKSTVLMKAIATSLAILMTLGLSSCGGGGGSSAPAAAPAVATGALGNIVVGAPYR